MRVSADHEPGGGELGAERADPQRRPADEVCRPPRHKAQSVIGQNTEE
jgi:hypothetical protein